MLLLDTPFANGRRFRIADGVAWGMVGTGVGGLAGLGGGAVIQAVLAEAGVGCGASTIIASIFGSEIGGKLGGAVGAVGGDLGETLGSIGGGISAG